MTQAAAIDRVRSLIELTESLTAIFDEENAALSERRPQAIAPLQDEKARLAAAYANAIREVAEDRSRLAGADDGLMETLREMTKRFEAGAARQRTLLDAAKTASEGVMRAIISETSCNQGYGDDKKEPSGAAALVLNESA